MPRYQELRETLAREIASGVFPVHARFPTEHNLCARFGVSRHTVREALRALEDQGLLARQAGAGTTVLARAPTALYTQTLDSISGLFEYAVDTAFEKKYEGFVGARDQLALLLGCKPGERWLRFGGARRLPADGVAVCWTEVFVAEPYFAIRGQPLTGSGPFYAQIQRQFGVEISDVEQRISALPMPAGIAAALGVAPRSPALLTRRRYFADRGDPFEISLSFHPGERYAYTQRLRRERKPAKAPPKFD